MADEREELLKLRRLKELEAKASANSPESRIAQARAQEEAFRQSVNPAEGMSWGDKAWAGAGKAVADLGRGAGQMMGLVDEQGVAESRARDAALMETGAGKFGNIAGNVAAFLPTMAIPGANTYTGAGLAGAAFGALQPTAEGESRAFNTALGGGLGVAGQAASNGLSTVLRNRAAAQQVARIANQPADDVLRESIAAGYSVPPSSARGGLAARLMEGLSGKYKTNQLAGIRNQEVTNQLARAAVNLPDNIPLTADAMKQLRQTAFDTGYAPVRAAGRVVTDGDFVTALDDAVRAFKDVANDFPALVDDRIIQTVDSLKKPDFDAASGLSAIRLLRDKAGAFFRAGEASQGNAAKGAANAIEDQIERHLTTMGQQGDELLRGFREARTLMAKAHTVEDILNEAGMADATKLAAELRRGAPLTGELRTAARFGDAFRDVAGVPKSGAANPLTVLDFGAGNAMGAAGLMSGNPVLGTMAGVGLPASRVAARYSILSGPVQRAMASKSYDPSMLAKALMSTPGKRAVASLPPALLLKELNGE